MAHLIKQLSLLSSKNIHIKPVIRAWNPVGVTIYTTKENKVTSKTSQLCGMNRKKARQEFQRQAGRKAVSGDFQRQRKEDRAVHMCHYRGEYTVKMHTEQIQSRRELTVEGKVVSEVTRSDLGEQWHMWLTEEAVARQGVVLVTQARTSNPGELWVLGLLMGRYTKLL